MYLYTHIYTYETYIQTYVRCGCSACLHFAYDLVCPSASSRLLNLLSIHELCCPSAPGFSQLTSSAPVFYVNCKLSMRVHSSPAARLPFNRCLRSPLKVVAFDWGCDRFERFSQNALMLTDFTCYIYSTLSAACMQLYD